MTRLRADLTLLVVALIWGTAFVAQAALGGALIRETHMAKRLATCRLENTLRGQSA